MLLFIRVLFSTALVLGVIWYAARMVRQPRGFVSKLRLPGSSSSVLVENRTSLNRTTLLAVVRFEGQRLLVAANDQAVTVLANASIVETQEPAAELAEAPAPSVVNETAAAPEELSAVQEALQPSSFIDVLRSYTVRTTVDSK